MARRRKPKPKMSAYRRYRLRLAMYGPPNNPASGPLLRPGTAITATYVHRFEQGEYGSRTGMVLAFVPAGMDIWRYMPGSKGEVPKDRVHFRHDRVARSRYLMVVNQNDGPHYYTARRTQVQLARKDDGEH